MRPRRPPSVRATAVALVLASAAAASAEDPPIEKPKGDLRSAVEGVVGLPVHGTFTNRYRFRTSKDGTDQDFHQYLDLRVGDETKDRVSGALFVRATEDLDRAHEDEHGFVFRGIDDAHDHSVNALLYSAYATIRPQTGPIDSFRLGRQYVYAAETFHIDGAAATTRALVESIQLKVTAYGGVPVHFYEAKSSRDWLAGIRVAASPWKGGRAAVDYVHDQDRLSLLGVEPRNDLAAASLDQQIGKHVDVFGQFKWLDGPRDATLRATALFPESDLLLQASYYRLLETKKQLATEFDPYTYVMQELVNYHQADVRASKGFGDHWDVNVGASQRRLLHGDSEGAFNHDTRRVYVSPSVSDLPWKGTSASVTLESWTGNGQRTRTAGFDVTHKFAGGLKLSAGSDYALYGFGPLATDERSHVRTAYVRAKFPLTKALSADVRYAWERDDVETFHVLTLALVLDF